MAKPNSKPKSAIKRVQHLVDIVQSNLDSFYKNTFFSLPDSSRELDMITDKLHQSLDNIVSNNVNNVGVTNISTIYNRLSKLQNDSEITKSISNIFEDKSLMDNLMSSYFDNKWLKDIDNEIDVVCKYMPKLEEALETRRDNVLSSDHFTKDYLNIASSYNVSDESLFNKHINELKDKYDLLNFVNDVYYETDKYGEQFIYVVPYKTAISKLLKNKAQTINTATMNFSEMAIISESGDFLKMDNPGDKIDTSKMNGNISLIFNESNMLDDLIRSKYVALERLNKIKTESLAYMAMTEAKKEGDLKVDKTVFPKDDLEYEKVEEDDVAVDGLTKYKKSQVDSQGNIISDKDFEVNIPGSVLKVLDRYNIIPVYVDNLCLGYYYIESYFNNESFHQIDNANLADPLISMKSSTRLYNEPDVAKQDEMLKYISGQLSKFIDKKFVNLNQDIAKEIYMILKHNDLFNMGNNSLRVTFLPPEDVIHTYFKLDKRTHRGISSLSKSLLPAKLYAGLYITNTIAVMTRAQDRRVYYVKQNVDTNISKVLLTTIEQIKKNNFNIRQIENINQVLNIIGRFNDFVIPMNSSGEAPVQFEVMQGQNIDPQTELMERLQEMAINSTDVPLELIQARQSVDYALQLTMTNSKFLRKVFNYQAKFGVFLSALITKLYNSEYVENCDINVKLPPPMFLNITNVNQLMDNTNAMVENIINIYIGQNDQDGIKRDVFTKNLKLHYLKSYIDIDAVEAIYKRSEQEADIIKTGQGNEEQ